MTSRTLQRPPFSRRAGGGMAGTSQEGPLSGRRSRAALAPMAVALAALLGGCLQPTTGSSPTQWSSKQRSAFSAGPPSLGNLPAPLVLPPAGDARSRALHLLSQAAESSSPLVRAHAVEAIQADPASAREALTRSLVDPNRGVRFVSAMAVGLNKLCDIAHLVEPLTRDESPSVQAAAIFALDRCGLTVDPTPLAAMTLSDDPEVRGNAAMVLGEMGNPSAIAVLQNCLGRGMATVLPARVRIVELQVAEAQVKLGNVRAADPIRAALFSPPEQAELSALACQICGRLKDGQAATGLLRLVEASGPDERQPEVRLAAIVALSQIGTQSPRLFEVANELAMHERPEVRAQAAVTLGHLQDPRGLSTATMLMSDADPLVQTAAAGAVLRLAP